jgi:multiple sugar transport system substrate-binding protein
MKRRLTIAVVVLVSGWCAALAPACRRTEAHTNPAGRVVIQYWEKWGGFEADAMREVIADFNRAQNRIEVRFLTISPIDVKLMLAASGGNPPDLAGLWEYNIPDFADKGALLPLDHALADAGLGAGHYVPAFWGLGRHRGFTWALPSTPGCVALFYNKRLFREAGLDPDQPPRSFAELEDMNLRLTRVELERNGGRVRIPFAEMTEAERASGQYTLVQIGHQPNDVGGMNVSCWGYWFGANYWDGDSQILANDAGNLAAYRWMRDAMTTFGVDQQKNFIASFGQSSTHPVSSGA